MKRVLFFLITTVLIASLAVIPAVVYSGAFDANDYGGGGGGSDWGDSGSDWGDGGSSWSGNGDVSEDPIIIVLTIAFIIVIVVISNKLKKTGKTGAGQSRPSSLQGLHIHLPDRTSQIENLIKQNDPNFSANDFLSFAKEVYIDIQAAWCKRDMTPVRPMLHDNLYNTTVQQVKSKIEQGIIYHYESMVVNTAYLTSYAKDLQFEYLTIYLNARMIDWQEDEKTGKILRGDKTTRWDLRYKMKFMRSAGVKTKEEVAKASGHNCPNCGAPMEVSSSGKCDYCGSVVTTGQYSWVLSDFGTIRNDTIDEGIKE